MITKIVLGNGEELTNILDIHEVYQQGGENSKSLNIVINASIVDVSLESIQNIFSSPETLSNIQVYRKDADYNSPTGEFITHTEYLDSTIYGYTTIYSMSKQFSSKHISIYLIQ